jgi:uncharacterized protein
MNIPGLINLYMIFKSIFSCILLVLTMQAVSLGQRPPYDSLLAKKLGADDYGMKSYVLVILKTGLTTIEDKAEVSRIFQGHMQNIGRLADEGKLIVAGPLGKNPNSYRGIFIFDVKTIEEAINLVQTDPAVSSKLLDADYYEWYGAAALSSYLEVQDKITKNQF